MKPLNFRAFDLNLLPILDALLDEQSVSLAGERLNLSQSATSSALLRLREVFNDPILIREGQRMTPSRRALLIRDRLKVGLATMSSVIVQLRNDERETRRRLVSLCAPEHVQLTLASAINAIMMRETNDLEFRISTLDQREMIKQLDTCRADIAMGSFGSLSEKFRRRRLYKETMVVVMRHGHPATENVADLRLALPDLSRYPHLVVSSNEDVGETHLARWLTSKSVTRKVSAVVQHISMISDILKDTDMICLGTERSFRVTPGGDEHLVCAKMPAGLEGDQYFVEMVWHDRTDQDEALAEVREAICGFCRSL